MINGFETGNSNLNGLACFFSWKKPSESFLPD